MKRNLNFLASAIAMLLLATAFMGCRDKCKRVTCVNGTCVDGTCNCDSGYFQEDCGSVINVGFVGTWTSTEACTAGSDGGSVAVAASGASKTEVSLVGLWDFVDDTIRATVGPNGLDVSIARQAVGTVEVAGEGLANAAQDELNLTYRVYNAGQTVAFDVCTAALTKN